MHIVLYQPEIPPNTGNIIRLCANSGTKLHLIRPLGFILTEKSCRRAGLDYSDMAWVEQHDDWESFRSQYPGAIIALSTKGEKPYHQQRYTANSILLFGPETRGLPNNILEQDNTTTVRIPMATKSRSLNLANSCSIVLYESLRQNHFQVGKDLLL